jgi:hypothetical protein
MIPSLSSDTQKVTPPLPPTQHKLIDDFIFVPDLQITALPAHSNVVPNFFIALMVNEMMFGSVDPAAAAAGSQMSDNDWFDSVKSPHHINQGKFQW